MTTKILIFIVIIFSTQSHAKNEDLRWYYFADIWALSPQLNMLEYNSYPLNEAIDFYSDKSLKSKAFSLTSIFVSFKNGEECRLDVKHKVVEATKWLSCRPYKCEVKSSDKPIKIEIVDPFENEWIKNDYSASPKRVICSKQLSAYISQSELPHENFHYLNIPASQEQTVSIGGQSFFGDFSNCKNELSRPCKFRQSAKNANDNLNFKIESAKKVLPSNKLPIAKCFEKNAKEIEKCLNEFTYKGESGSYLGDLPLKDDNVVPYRFEPIVWNDNLKDELKACLKNNIPLDFLIYKGLKKKCMFITSDIAVIDYPEAFIKFHSFGKNSVNIQIDDSDF